MNVARSIGWATAAVMAAGLLGLPALAQTPVDLSGSATGATAGGAVWWFKDVGTDTSTAPAAKDFAGATAANGWKNVAVPADLGAATGTGDVADNTSFWYVLPGLKIPAGFPATNYLELTGLDVQDSDVTYFNGVAIGAGTGATARDYIVPTDIVNFGGTNIIAIYGTHGSTGMAGIAMNPPMLQTAATDTGALVVRALSPTGSPVRNVLVTTTDAMGNEVNTLTDSGGEIVYKMLPPGMFPVQIASYPWIGSIAPTGTQNETIAGGQAAVLNLTVSPFVYNVYQAMTPIVIDGNITGPEWDGAQQMSVTLKKQAAVNPAMWNGPDDCSGTAKWKWDSNYIYLAADVTDDVRANSHVANPMDGNMWQGDGFETYIQLDPYSRSRTSYQKDRDYQWTIGVAPDDSVSWKIFRNGPGDVVVPAIPDPMGNVKVITKKTGKPGYTIEARFPWAMLPDVNMMLIPPKAGTVGGIALAINDADDPMDATTTRKVQMSWNSQSDMWMNPASFSAAMWAGPPPATALCGDLNGDGKVSVPDASIALRIAVGLSTATAANMTGACGHNMNVAFATQVLHAAVFGTTIAPM